MKRDPQIPDTPGATVAGLSFLPPKLVRWTNAEGRVWLITIDDLAELIELAGTPVEEPEKN